MKLPNKVISYKECTLSRFPIILAEMKEHDVSPVQLYQRVRSKVDDIGEFIDILDCLYALRKIELHSDKGVLHYVGRDTV